MHATRPKFALSVMMKNEEDVILRTLRSVENWAHIVKLHDTGSTDNTMLIAREWSRVTKVRQNAYFLGVSVNFPFSSLLPFDTVFLHSSHDPGRALPLFIFRQYIDVYIYIYHGSLDPTFYH